VVESSNHSVDRRLGDVLRWPTEQSKVWTNSFVDSAMSNENVIAVVAVGSAIRPNVRSMDLDLVAIVNDPKKVNNKPPIEVDLRVYKSSMVDSLINGGNDLLGWAVTYGKAIYQRDHAWDLILHQWQNKVPLPSAEVATQRAEDAFKRFTKMLNLGDLAAAQEQAVSYVTHLARAEILKSMRYPTSRPELPQELRAIKSHELADLLMQLIKGESFNAKELTALRKFGERRSGVGSLDKIN
jgi:hypothetical protein